MPESLETIRRFVDAFNTHDPDAIAACYHPDAKVIYPGRDPQTPATHAAAEREMFAAVPDYTIEITSLISAEGGHAVLELTMQGTQREDLGGRAFSISGAYIFRVEDGLIAEERAYPDAAGLRRQLSPRR